MVTRFVTVYDDVSNFKKKAPLIQKRGAPHVLADEARRERERTGSCPRREAQRGEGR